MESPSTSRLHNVFHVSLLKAFKGSQLPPITAPPYVEDDRVIASLHAILCGRVNKGTKEVLVHWIGLTEAYAICESIIQFQLLYHSFKLEDKLFQ